MVRRYNGMSNEELIALTDEDVQRLIEIEIAYSGIEFVPEPTYEEVEAVDIVASDVAYSIGGLILADEADAIAISRMKFLYEAYLDSDYQYKYLKDDAGYKDEPSVTPVRYYNKDDLRLRKDALLRSQAASKRNEQRRKEYDAFLKATEEIRTKVYDAIRVAREWLRTVENANRALDKYRQLSAGDESIARRFFVDAYRNRCDGEEIIKAVIGEEGIELIKVLEAEKGEK